LVVGLVGAALMFLTAFAPSLPAPEPAGVGPGRVHHGPGPAEYINIGLMLAAITALEVGVYYVTALGGALIPILVILAASKFLLVVLFFMHLKFDNRLFSTLFSAGFILAIAVFMVALATLGASIN
ncbi:MAG: cytochrome C oxidase subunit IV family protein, partial [Dehalococcoidia bacterium]